MPLLPQRNGPHLGALATESGSLGSQPAEKKGHASADTRTSFSRPQAASLADLPPAGRRVGSRERFSLSLSHSGGEAPIRRSAKANRPPTPPVQSALARESRPLLQSEDKKGRDISPSPSSSSLASSSSPSLLAAAAVFSHPVHAAFASQLRAPSPRQASTRLSSSLGHVSPAASLSVSVSGGDAYAQDMSACRRSSVRSETFRVSAREAPPPPPHTQGPTRRASVSSPSRRRSGTPSYLNPTVASRQRSLQRSEERRGERFSRNRSPSLTREGPSRSSQIPLSSRPTFPPSSLTSSLRLHSVSATPGALPPLPPARFRGCRALEETEQRRVTGALQLQTVSCMRSSSSDRELTLGTDRGEVSRSLGGPAVRLAPRRALGEREETAECEEKNAEGRGESRSRSEQRAEGENTKDGRRRAIREAGEEGEARSTRRSTELGGGREGRANAEKGERRQMQPSVTRDSHTAQPRLSSSSAPSRGEDERCHFETPWALGPSSTPRRRSSASSSFSLYTSCSSLRATERESGEGESRPNRGLRSSASPQSVPRDSESRRQSQCLNTHTQCVSAPVSREEKQFLSAAARVSASSRPRADPPEARAGPLLEDPCARSFSSLGGTRSPSDLQRRSCAEFLLEASATDATANSKKKEEAAEEDLSSSSWLERDPLFRALSERAASTVRELPVDQLLADEAASFGAQNPTVSPRGRRSETGVAATGGDSPLFLSQQLSDGEAPMLTRTQRPDEEKRAREADELEKEVNRHEEETGARGSVGGQRLPQRGDNGGSAWSESNQTSLCPDVSRRCFFSLFSRQVDSAESAESERRGNVSCGDAHVEADAEESDETEAKARRAGGEEERDQEDERGERKTQVLSRYPVSSSQARREPSRLHSSAVSRASVPSSSSSRVSKENAESSLSHAWPSSLPPPPKRGLKPEGLSSSTDRRASPSLIPKARPLGLARPATARERAGQARVASTLSSSSSLSSASASLCSSSSGLLRVAGGVQGQRDHAADGAGGEKGDPLFASVVAGEAEEEASLAGRHAETPQREGEREGSEDMAEGGISESPASASTASKRGGGLCDLSSWLVSSFSSSSRRPPQSQTGARLASGTKTVSASLAADSVADERNQGAGERGRAVGPRLWREILRRALTLLLLLGRVLTSSYDSLAAHGGVRGVIASLEEAKEEKEEVREDERENDGSRRGSRARGDSTEQSTITRSQGSVERPFTETARGRESRGDGRKELAGKGNRLLVQTGQREAARPRSADAQGVSVDSRVSDSSGASPMGRLSEAAARLSMEKGRFACHLLSRMVCEAESQVFSGGVLSLLFGRRREGEGERESAAKGGARAEHAAGTAEVRKDSWIPTREKDPGSLEEKAKSDGQAAATERSFSLASPLFFIALLSFLGLFFFLTLESHEDDLVDIDFM
ncbi:hypothetical protein TGGT1_286190 [Toxoplasma gondii GT1]|uniref:Transmembrane protein n=4 Tax=Toxoplasma gondii TaxID=5811 RepID=S7W368_TOXGG|nr:hypothetical protein TGGT1_286190 [Toxoplasma gondii GT1]KAF4643830.1 hypothetical protein TGRH88_025860 [Toxoplasma gondii]KFG54783.1 putative transmembrane protein [Toxoplasma gondii FOU]PUA88056.1 putative transmembrane protein [Toxoplasma gondii TgCATBr9]